MKEGQGKMKDDPKMPTAEQLLVEYSAANDAYIHYDNFSWQVGAVLIAGAFVFWGFLLDGQVEERLFFLGSLLVAILMSLWMIYSSHNRQIYLCKLHRLQEIETFTGFKQHSRWIRSPGVEQATYKTFGPPGHLLDAAIYMTATLGAPFIGFFTGAAPTVCWRLLQILFFLFVTLSVIAWIRRNEKRLRTHLAAVHTEGAGAAPRRARSARDRRSATGGRRSRVKRRL